MAITELKDLTEERVLAEARQAAGLSDFGDLWFLEPMNVLLDSIHKEANLSAAGIAGQSARMISGLVSRLRMTDTIKRNPEILDENITVAGVICGLPRTGSTLFHRLLSKAPGFNAIKWYETQFYAPFPGEERGNPVARREAAMKVMDGYVQAGMMSVHPFAIDEPDEEIIIMDQFFVGTMPESAMYVPTYAEWLGTFDHGKAYQDLKTVLKFLQWYDVSRAGKRWVLKTPGHLPTLDSLLTTFPETVLISTHRDPLQTVPSYCSFVMAVYKMVGENVDEVKIGRFTEKRWAGFLSRYEGARERNGVHRFIDIKYEDIVKNPIDQARPVLERLGVPITPDVEVHMQEWLAENARDKRAAHHYTLEQFGLSEAELEKDFKAYRERFIL